MSGTVLVTAGGPGVTLQDAGRAGQTGFGLSRGGASDPMALIEAEALLGASAADVCIEISGMGARFQVTAPTRIALTGATAKASIDKRDIKGFVTELLLPGQTLAVGPIIDGVYCYLSFAGGLNVPLRMGGRGAHLLGRIGQHLKDGDTLELGGDPAPDSPARKLDPDRTSKGPVRIMPGPQTELFDEAVRQRFQATEFTRSARGNRQGVRMDHDGEGFATADQLALVSDFISEGDIQMTGDGRPFVLLSEHQTTGGYPRIGTVIPADLPRVAQAVPGTKLTFQLISLQDAEAAWRSKADILKRLKSRCSALVRDPRDIPELMSMNLISGVVSGRES